MYHDMMTAERERERERGSSGKEKRVGRSLQRPLRRRGSGEKLITYLESSPFSAHDLERKTHSRPRDEEEEPDDNIEEEEKDSDTAALLPHSTNSNNNNNNNNNLSTKSAERDRTHTRSLRGGHRPMNRSRTPSEDGSTSSASSAFPSTPLYPRTGSRPRVLGITNPLTLRWFFSIRGAECCHLYLWIIKDLAWTQSWREFSIYAGIVVLLWSSVLLYHSLRTLNWHEIWNFIASFLWLFANFWWMLGEAHDYEYPDQPPISLQHTYSSAKVLEVALLWCLIYYLVILPFDLLPVSAAALEEYEEDNLRPRCPCFFASFRQYENLHTLFWIAKDLAWNLVSLTLWLVCLVPTLLLAMDFMYLSITTKSDDSTVDTVHFWSVLVWVIANSIWAYGDFFYEEYSEPMEMWSSVTEGGFRNARWYSSWALVAAMVPIAILYVVWTALTLSGALKPRPEEESLSCCAWPSMSSPAESDVNSADSSSNANVSHTISGHALPSTSPSASLSAKRGSKGNSHRSHHRNRNAGSLLRLLKSERARGRLVLQSMPSNVENETDLDMQMHSDSDWETERENETERDALIIRSPMYPTGAAATISSERERSVTNETLATGNEIEMVETPSVRCRQSSLSNTAANSTGNLSPSPSPSSAGQMGIASALQRLFYPSLLERKSSKDSSDGLDALAVNNENANNNTNRSSSSGGLILDDDELVSLLQENH